MSDKLKYELKDKPGKKKSRTDELPAYKTEETLRQEARERLAEQDRIEAAQERTPSSERKKRIDNFYYHYKWHTIASVFIFILAVFFIRDTVFRAKPDLTVIVATSRFLAQSETEGLTAALAKNIDDFNGDGKKIVNLDTINLPLDVALGAEDGGEDSLANLSGVDPEMMQASMMKLMAVVAAWTDPMYLTDDILYDYMAAMSGDYDDDDRPGGGEARQSGYSLFVPLEGVRASFGPNNDRLAIKDTILAEEPGLEYLGEIAFSLRPPQNHSEKAVKYQEYCAQILRSLIPLHNPVP